MNTPFGMVNLTTNFVITPSDNRGIYYESTRRVLVFLPQHENIEDIYKTLAHEVYHHCFSKLEEDEYMDESSEEALIFNLQWAEFSLC